MPTQRDPDARAQAALDHDPGAAPHRIPAHQQPRWMTPDSTDGDAVALGVLLSTLPADDARYIAARLAIELREEHRDLVASSIAISEHRKTHHPDRHNHVTHAELEIRRSTYDGALDRRHLALRADPDRAAARRRRRGAA